jgi:hypothetical protein
VSRSLLIQELMLGYRLPDCCRVNNLLLWWHESLANLSGLPLTPPDLKVLDGRELGPSNALGCLHIPL